MSRSIEEVVKEITEARQYLESRKIVQMTIDELSSASVKLSLLKMNLGEYLANEMSELEAAENASYFVYRQEAGESKGMSQEDAKNKARLDFKDKRKEIAVYEYLRKDLGDLITSLQSRCKALLEERKDTNFGSKTE